MPSVNNPTRPFSIRRRLLWQTALIGSAMILIVGVLVYQEARHEIDEVYDARLGQEAKTLALGIRPLLALPPLQRDTLFEHWYRQILSVAGDSQDTGTDFGHPYEQNMLFQVLRGQDQVLLNSPSVSSVAVLDSDAPGFHHFVWQGEPWRGFQLLLPEADGSERGARLLIAEKQAIRTELINEIALSTVLPLGALIPLIVLMLAGLISLGFRPLKALGQAVALRSPANLDAIEVNPPTQELTPLVNQLNALLHHLQQAWARERRLIQTVAHELKTPLAVLRLDAENALRAGNRRELEADLNRMLNGIARTDRLIQQLLLLSKVEGEQALRFRPGDLAQSVRQRIRDLTPISEQKAQQLTYDGPAHAPMTGNWPLLDSLIANLLDNAMRYGPAGAPIRIRIAGGAPEQDAYRLSVEDQGPAIAEGVRQRVFEPFFRGDTGAGDGAGLGLAIVNDIVRLHGGSVSLRPASGPTGNAFEITLPRHG